MTVLVLSHMFPNEREPSAGIFVLEQVRALRKLGITVLVVSPTPWAPSWLRFLPSVRKYLAIPRQSSVDGFVVLRPRVPTLPRERLLAASGLLFYLSCRRLVARLARETRIDLIHAHAILPDGFAAVLLGGEFQLPVVCTAHGSDVRVAPLSNRIVRWASVWALRHVDRLIGVSGELQTKAFLLAGVRQFTVIHNGADHKTFMPVSKEEARRRLHLTATGKLICFVGYLRLEKALDNLLQGFALLGRADSQLCIVGDGPLKAALTAQAESLNIAHACLFAGARPHDEIPLWLSAADCLALCSLTEGMPTILPEAMLCRVPIVATPVGGIPEIIRHGETGLLVPCSDGAAIAAALNSLLSNPRLAWEIANRAETFSRASLTWDINARQTLAVYEDAMHSSKLPRIPKPTI
ncbi:MAG TPA: glycosyltransferase [Terriglobales bacterium]|nr:glycosyltransferase [Terriglobales bacterium]